MTRSKIEWTDAVWNPVTGCTKVSAGCAHCYAERMSKRLAGRCGYPADEPFRVTLHPDRLEEPLRWRTQRRVFVCSMGDLFHSDVPGYYLRMMFGVMSLCGQHTFIVLTKRPDFMSDFFRAHDCTLSECQAELMASRYAGAIETATGKTRLRNPEAINGLGHNGWPLPNVWLGVSTEDQAEADRRIPLLLQTPAAVRFVSCEPLLGPIDLTSWVFDRRREVSRLVNGPAMLNRDQAESIVTQSLNWVIVGGESGPEARPCDIAWIRSIIEQCKAAEVPVFAKQLGENCVGMDLWPGPKISRKGNDLLEWPVDLQVRQWPKER